MFDRFKTSGVLCVLCLLAMFASVFPIHAFEHPSTLHTQADFDRMKTKVNASAHPWVDGWNVLINMQSAQLNYPTHAQGTLQRGNGGGACLPADNYQFAMYDTAAAYQMALRWKVSGDNSYADAAINILNQWSSICTNLCGDPNIQLLEIYGYQFAVAGDIMRSYTNWAPADVTRYQDWMRNLWYPMASGFLKAHMGACSTHHWANWDLSSMNAVMAIGILCDDTNIYNEALTYFKTGIGNGNIEQTVYYMHPGYLGQGQEEGRDQGHSGMDMAMLGVFCSMAYNQGEDLFAYQNNRVLAMCEYFAKFNIGEDVPYLPYKNCDAALQTNLGGSSRGDNRPCWDLIYNHYVNLKGIAAPWSEQYAARNRPDGGGLYYGSTSGAFDQLGFTTLTCSRDPIVVGRNPTGLTAVLNGQQQVQLNWWGTASATNYLVKRATISGGPYTTLATITTNLLTYTDSNVTNGVTYYYTVSAMTPLGESGNGNEAVVSIQPELIAFYKFDQTSGLNVTDNSGNGRTAKMNGATFLVSGHSNYCANMNGAGQYVTVPTNITANLADFTIATWVYLNGAQGYWARIFDFGVAQSAVYGSTYYSTPTRYMYLAPSAGAMRFAITVGTGEGEQYINASSVVPSNAWHHVAVTLSGNTGMLYLDGVPVGTNTITITPAQLGTVNSNYIGKSQWTGDPYLAGRVDDFRIYKGALSATQIASLVAAYPVQPPAPTNVVATAISANEIDLTWSPAAGATNYYVKRSTVSGGPYTTISVPLTATNFNDTGLIGSKTYYYVITAVNEGGVTNSAQVSATTLTPPVAPASLTASAVSSSQINLSWPASSGATGYTVKSANFSGRPYTVIASNLTATAYTNASLLNAVTYYYVVTASNANGESTNSIEASATTQPLPAVPTGLSAAGGSATVQLSWTASSYAASYNVKRSTVSGSGYVTIANPSSPSFTDTDVTNGTTYFYVVSAVNAVGESANSSQANATPADLLNWWKFDEGSGVTAVDSGAAGRNGTLQSGGSWVSGAISNAMHTDGSANGYVNFAPGLVSSLNDFSICCWVKADVSATWARVFDFGSGTGTYMFLSPFNGSGVPRYAIINSSSGGEQGINGPSAISTGVWHHMAVTLSGNTGVLYIDGVAVASNNSMTLKPSSLGNTSQNYIGKSQWNDPNLTGSVDDFRIYARALTAGEIAAMAAFVPQAPGSLTATPGDAKATLVWNSSSGATSYNVKRSTTSGSGFVTVGSATVPHFVDTGLANGTTYYYVVSATNAAGESANSSQASVTPNVGGATALFWSGAANSTWDTATANWLNGAASTTFADGNIAIFDDAGANTSINLSASRSPGAILVNNATANYAISGSPITGTGSLTKSGTGLLTLNGANTFTGGATLNVGQVTLGVNSVGSGNSVSSGPLGAGTVTLAGGKLQMSAKTLGNNLSATTGTTSILDNTGGDGYLDGNLSGGGTLTLQNSSGIGLSLKIAFNAAVDWSAFTGTLNYYAVNSQVFNVFMPSACNLSQATLNSGGNGTPPGNWSSMRFGAGTTRLGALSGPFGYLECGGTLEVGNLNASTTFGGVLQSGNLTKVGTGALRFTGANTYNGSTTVSNGTLLISSVSNTKGNYTVATGATLAMTNASAGSAQASGLTLAASSALEFQNVSSGSIPLLAATNIVVSGTCVVKITGTSGLVVGNSYPLISYAGTLSGSFTNFQLQMPYGWRGALSNVANQIVLANVAAISTNPPSVTPTLNGQQLQLSWPQSHTGWRLLMQTNNLANGISADPNDWTTVAISQQTNQMILPVDPALPSQFFRLVYP